MRPRHTISILALVLLTTLPSFSQVTSIPLLWELEVQFNSISYDSSGGAIHAFDSVSALQISAESGEVVRKTKIVETAPPSIFHSSVGWAWSNDSLVHYNLKTHSIEAKRAMRKKAGVIFTHLGDFFLVYGPSLKRVTMA